MALNDTPQRPAPPMGALMLSAFGGLVLAAGVLAQFMPDLVGAIHPALVAGKTPLGLILLGLGLEAMGLKGVLGHAQRRAVDQQGQDQ